MIFHYEARNENILEEGQEESKEVLDSLNLESKERQKLAAKEGSKALLADIKYESRAKIESE
ncbi:hypothetical protein [Orenia marismortui]|uniref:Uncharacterized protein n=1 Tax=Orenia marismortui TaxID=46469 RepID=A0A4R8H7W6_9FIRM|nr:hypothetical protein [Orenia marismortui]TDX51658.1 hypothetical protein C7959_11154 [Orenia marismortui]